MASTPEGLVKKRVKALLDKYDALHFSPMGTGYGVSGVSDIIALHNGRMIAIECKADAKKQPTDLQKRFLSKVIDRGGYGRVIHKDNIDELEQLLEHLGE